MALNCWLFPQNSCDLKQFFITLQTMNTLNGINRSYDVQQLLMDEQVKNGKYNPYNKAKNEHDVSSANHKIDEPRFYGAIYETPNKKIYVSSYGKLLLKYKDDLIKRNKIFIGMLFNIQFNHPFKNMKDLNIYPVRLIFQLLIEERLNKTLSNIEIAYILYFIKEINNISQYNSLILEILSFRKLSKEEKKEKLNNEAKQFIKNYVSCNYFCNILKELKIVNLLEEKKEDKTIFKIKSPVRSKPTSVSVNNYSLEFEYIKFIDEYLKEATIYEDIRKMKGLKSDWIREVYNSVPDILLELIEEKDEQYTEYLRIPKLLVESSTNPNKWAEFEECITKSFNLFYDIKAETISGPGEPDMLGFFVPDEMYFCADGKSTKNKLLNINDGRLKQHRKKYEAKYTVVVTPGYVPSALMDVEDTNTCIITSYCFSDLITNYIFKYIKNKQGCSYKKINEIILDNLGLDISEKIYKLIDDEIGISKNSIIESKHI